MTMKLDDICGWRGKTLIAILLAGLALIPMLPAAAWSGGPSSKHFNDLTIYWENDWAAGTDRDYTNGLKLTLSTPFGSANPELDELPEWAYPVIKALPHAGIGKRYAVSIAFGQNIFTPEDTRSRELVVDDRPYAGYTYIGVGLHVNDGRRREVWEVDVGVVGPLSMGQEAQDFVHDLIGSSKSQGWEHQLKNEPVLELIYESKWQSFRAQDHNGFGFDVIPHVGGRLGNVAIYANAGIEFRLGWHVPRNFGSCTIRPGCEIGAVADSQGSDAHRSGRFGIHLFTGLDARYVVRDIFLDGNTYSESHSVDREPFVADLIGGIAMSHGRWRMSYAYVWRTKEFEQRDDNLEFGALTLSFTF